MHSNQQVLWGEMSEVNETINLTRNERELLSRIPRALPLEGPRIHQPSQSSGQFLSGSLFFERSGGGNCEAISDVAERVLNFSILYTHICGGVNKFRFCIIGVKIGAKSVT
jgi:hypothetical protein